MSQINRIMFFQKLFLLVAYSIMLFGCNEENDYRNTIKKEIGIDIPDKFKEINLETNVAMGDYSESVYLKFDSVNFTTIVRQILDSPYYTGVFIEAPQISRNTKKGYKKWYKSTKGYKFEYNINGFREFIECYIDTTELTIYYHYIQE